LESRSVAKRVWLCYDRGTLYELGNEMMRMSIYIHFPFCKSKCLYCDFCSFAADETVMERYCECLMREMELTAEQYGDAVIDTVYFGGGTPSIVPAPLMRKVINTLHHTFCIPRGIEFTSEANPGAVDDAWLEVMTKGGMNRLSIGVQAKQDRLLQLMGRIHSFAQARETLELARRYGVDNLSADLMFGLPMQTLEDYNESIRAVAQLGVQHISAYALKVEEDTKLHAMIKRGELELPDEELAADMMDSGIELLHLLGYQRYEISNFTRPGYRSEHNLKYWRQAYYLGLGLNAASMLPAVGGEAHIRRTNTSVLREYSDRLHAGRLPVRETSDVSRDEAKFETVMLGLRTTDGVSLREFEKMHGVMLFAAYGDAIRTLRERGWLQPIMPEDPYLALNDRGLAMQNAALMLFME